MATTRCAHEYNKDTSNGKPTTNGTEAPINSATGCWLGSLQGFNARTGSGGSDADRRHHDAVWHGTQAPKEPRPHVIQAHVRVLTLLHIVEEVVMVSLGFVTTVIVPQVDRCKEGGGEDKCEGGGRYA